MRVAVIAEEDGTILGIAECRIYRDGQLSAGEPTNIVGRRLKAGTHDTTEIESVMLELPDELRHRSLGDLVETMKFDASGESPRLVPKES